MAKSLRLRQLLSVSLLLLLVFSLLGTSTVSVQAEETRNIVILGTSDIHGNVDGYDYFTDAPTTRGLTRVATYVKGVVASNPNTILIDNGDTIQGTPLAYWAEILHPELPNPLAATMKAMGYVAATVGNHEFNYGPTVFNKFQSEAWAAGAGFPTLSANVTGCRDYTFTPYVIKDVGGVQVGILGLTPPAVVHWERPENIVDCEFGDAMAAANAYVPQMKADGADVIVVAAHTGWDETYGYGREENFVKYLVDEVPGIDVILAGHSHTLIPSSSVPAMYKGVLITEPNYHTRNVSDIRITVSGSGSDWTITDKSVTVPAINNTLAEDTAIKAITQPYHDGAVTYINTEIGTAEGDFPGGLPARVADGPMADLINQVQMEAAAAAGFPVDASLAALFNSNAKLTAGPIKLKDAFAVYIYDNTLYVIEATGQMVKDELEWTATYFNQYFYEPGGVTINSSKMPDYNYDLWSGIEYTVDVTKPVGQRVVELNLHGQPLAMDQKIRIALNNYRATGRAEFKPATILYQSTTEVRELITNWIMDKGTIAPSDVFVQNYTFLPPAKTWLPANVADPVTRTDYAGLLWSAFDGNTDNYMRVPDDKMKPAANFNRQEALTILATRPETLAGMWNPDTTDVKPLKQYTDFTAISGWAKPSIVFTTGLGIFTPTGNQVLPKQLVTNAEALAWVREARYPLFTFLSTNDMHGYIETGGLVGTSLVGGAAYNMTYVNQYTAQNPVGTLLMDGGDMMQGRPISNLLFGESVIDVYNHMGYDAAVIGNHEFDWKIDKLQERMAQAEFPILLANIFLEDTDTRPDWAIPTAMLDVKGQQVGVIGVTSIDTPSVVMAGNLDGYEFHPAGPIVEQLAAELRAQGADIVVVLAHMPDVYNGTRGEILGVAQPGVDLIISGHNHNKYTGAINNIPIIQQYTNGTAIGVSDLRYDRINQNILSSALKVVTTYNKDLQGNDIGADPAIAALVAEYRAEVGPTLDRVIATTDGAISRDPDRYTMEVAMGDLIADAQRWQGGTQIAFMNPGGIRASITCNAYPCDITWETFYTVQPFDNKLMTMDLTGAQLYAVLEQQFKPPQASMKLLQQSGLKYTFDLSQPVGSRITSLTLKDGTAIDPAATYSVTLNEYIGTGGDNFSTFLLGTNRVKIEGVNDFEALIAYVQDKYGVPPDNTPIDPSIYPDGRTTNVTP